jgi:hypothetical protein
MGSADRIADLGPLPESDENAELQRSSIKALNSLLQDQDALLFRDERTEDYGVDGTFELKIADAMTNFRAQVQLKGTSSVQARQDGSISLSVRTTNLNYLLNGTSPIYLLFDAKKRAFWYVWAHNEHRRLEAANPAWREQETVSLKFTERLTKDALTEIVQRVVREGRMHRQIQDSLVRSTSNEPVVVSIDAASLALTDPSEAEHVLLGSGPAIVAAGFPREVLRMLDIIDLRRRDAPRLQLTAGYAEYMLGKHYGALGHLRQALVRSDQLSERERNFLSRLKDACEFHVGLIDAATYRQRTAERAQALHGIESLEARMETVYYQFLRERDHDVRATLTRKAHEITGEILKHPEATEPVKLRARLLLLYVEGAGATVAATHQLGLYRMRERMFATHTKVMRRDYRQADSRLADWGTLSNAALKDARRLRHPILIGEAFAVVLSVRNVQLLNRRIEALSVDKVFEVPEQVVSKVLEAIASALAIHQLNGSVEDRLRLNILHADFLEIVGDVGGAKKLAAQICPEAEAMGFADIAERAKELLDDRTMLMEFEREWRRFQQIDEDIWFGDLSDQELQEFSRDALQSLDLPPARLGVVQQYCESLREVARERSQWCRHLQMLEELTQTRDLATAFSVPPNRRCMCEKFGYETTIVSPDATGLMGAFKQLYCAGCKDRSPKQ